MIIICHQIIFNRKDLGATLSATDYIFQEHLPLIGKLYFLWEVKTSKETKRNYLIDGCIAYKNKQVKWAKPDIYYSIF